MAFEHGQSPQGVPAPPVPIARRSGDSAKSQQMVFVLSMLLGWLGADRFYMGQTLLGVLKLVTCGGSGFWTILDNVLAGMGKLRDDQGRLADRGPVYGTPVKSQSTAFLLSFFIGALGLDRFYLGYIGLGILKLVTGGGFGIWAIIDLYLIGMGRMRDAEGNSLAWDDIR